MLKDALEANIKQAIELMTPVMRFIMVNHAATIINSFFVDQDGMTPMEKAKWLSSWKRYCSSP